MTRLGRALLLVFLLALGWTMRQRLLILMFGLGVGVLGLWAYYKFEDRRFRQELRQAQSDFSDRRIYLARARLAGLAARWPGACGKFSCSARASTPSPIGFRAPRI